MSSPSTSTSTSTPGSKRRSRSPSSHRRWSRRVQHRAPSPGPPTGVEHYDFDLKIKPEPGVDPLPPRPLTGILNRKREKGVEAEEVIRRNKSVRFSFPARKLWTPRVTPTTTRSRSTSRKRSLSPGSTPRKRSRSSSPPTPIRRSRRNGKRKEEEWVPNPLAVVTLALTPEGSGAGGSSGFGIGSIQRPEGHVVEVKVEVEVEIKQEVPDSFDGDDAAPAITGPTDAISVKPEKEEVDEREAEDVEEPVSPSTYPPIEVLDEAAHLKNYSEMISVLRIQRGLSPTLLERRRQSTTVALLEQLQEQQQQNDANDGSEVEVKVKDEPDLEDVKDCDLTKLQWELESLLLDSLKRKRILAGFATGGVTDTSGVAAAPPAFPVEKIEEIKQEIVEEDDGGGGRTGILTSTSTSTGSGGTLGRGLRQKKNSRRKSEQTPTVPRASMTKKNKDKQEVGNLPEVVEIKVEEEEEPDPEEVKKIETRKEFHEFVDAFIGQVTSTEVEYINHLWHLGKYEYSPRPVACSMVKALYKGVVGYNPPDVDVEVTPTPGSSDKVTVTTTAQKGEGSRRRQTRQKTTSSAVEGSSEEMNKLVKYTSLRRDPEYISRLESEIRTIHDLSPSIRMVLVRPADEWSIRGLIPPLTLSPLLRPQRKQRPGIEIPGGGGVLELELELETVRIVNAINLLGLKTKAEESREYFALKDRLQSLDNCLIEAQSGIERVKKRIREFGDKDGEEGANLRRLREAGKSWLKSRLELCKEMDILEDKLFPPIGPNDSA